MFSLFHIFSLFLSHMWCIISITAFQPKSGFFFAQSSSLLHYQWNSWYLNQQPSFTIPQLKIVCCCVPLFLLLIRSTIFLICKSFSINFFFSITPSSLLLNLEVTRRKFLMAILFKWCRNFSRIFFLAGCFKYEKEINEGYI